MSLCTLVEVALHFESFRNVDLFHQGLYHLKCRIYRDDEVKRVLAVPYSNLKGPSQAAEPPKGKTPRADHHHLIPAHVTEDQFTFSTRSFLIRYCEEEVELGDVGQFRVELGPEELERRHPLLLEVELMFADLTQQGGADHLGEQPDVEAAEFRCVSTQVLRLRGAERGLHEFCPVVFDECHFCLLNLAVHSAVVDLRFRLRPPLANQLPVAKPKVAGPAPRPGAKGNGEGGEAQEGEAAEGGGGDVGVPAVVKHSQAATPKDGSKDHDQERPPLNWQAAPPAALSLAEHLFGEELGSGIKRNRLLQVAEGLYRRHLGALASSYAQQAAWMKLICDRCLTPLQREALFGNGGEVDSDKCTVPADLGLGALKLPKGMVLPQPPPTPSGLGRAATGASAGIGSLKPAAGYEQNGESVLQESLAARLGDKLTPQGVARLLAFDLNIVSCQILELWHQVLNVMSYAYREIASMLRAQWEERIIDQWGVSIVREKMNPNLAEPDTTSIGERHTVSADNLRKTVKPRSPELASLEDTSLLPPIEQRPVLFDQRCAGMGGTDPTAANGAPHPSLWEPRVPSAPKQYRGVHLFVLCHGFQGNSFDMRLMKNNIALLYPDAIFLCSQANEDNTEGDFNEMGIRLAQEVTNFICDWCPGSALGRLSFIAHSIGGLIVRSALPLLQEYKDKMFTILTFSSPHVGYFLKNLSLFHLGLKVLQSWRGSQCLTQLSMADASDPRETFIYKLSKSPGFEFFQNVVLVSCASDSYGPFDSARVEIGSMLNMHTDQDAYREIVQNLWKPVKPERVFRFDVNFHIPDNNLDTFIGRAAHIQFLECQPIMRMIIHNFSFLFR
eukprot:TRINITY_DN106678_c0_g1_i1.p1 TRINITY_DN106678_c0_g1~~TRINITY_DN106678_c0_g1_i1.p1  ORF type:complete len:843 (+),score=175.66 TRINITY_DN106678_c0_g1_i1:79-2607(+)